MSTHKHTAEWEYSHFRASLKRNGEHFAIVTPDGHAALPLDKEEILLHRLNTHDLLVEALEDAVKLLKDLHRWESIEAQDSDNRLWLGSRSRMPEGLVETSNASGLPPEEMNEKLGRFEASIAAAKGEVTALNQGKEKE